MKNNLRYKLDAALWVAHTLFHSRLVTGTTGNISFLHENKMYISGSGTSFGTLDVWDFACIDPNKTVAGKDGLQSKEYPLHQRLYCHDPSIGAVVHTHSFYSTLWACLQHPDPEDVIPAYTPYLKMKLGKIRLIPYAKPGSQELFEVFEQRLGTGYGYLLANHGPIVGGSDLHSAFHGLEELEESARIAWELRHESSAIHIGIS